MQCGFLFSILLSCMVARFAAMRTINSTSPENPGKCSIYPDIVLSPGERIRDPGEKCGIVQCHQGGFASFINCDATKVRGCYLGLVSINREFPDCCEMRILKCTAEESDEDILAVVEYI